MNNAIYNFKEPENEPIKDYLKGSAERTEIEKEINFFSKTVIDIPLIIGGKEIRTGNTGKVVMPNKFIHTLATYQIAGEKEVKLAIEAALKAKDEWSNISWTERASIMIKAAELISKKHRYLLNAATMLGQGKNIYQAEIDAACEVVDYLRFNTYFASQIYSEQPTTEFDMINRMEHRPLEGFVFTVSPFNFTAIASNLNTSVALMGNTTVWKPANASLLSSYYLMTILKEAGLPDGVINFVPGKGSQIAEIVLNNSEMAGIHFTGSTSTFKQLWKTVSNNLDIYRTFPKLVGEIGGKDFIFVHESAIPEQVATAIIRGAFEYQGQKCSAASRAYIPESLWEQIKEILIEEIKSIKVSNSANNYF